MFSKIKIDKTHDLAKLSFELLKVYPDALDIDLKFENVALALKTAHDVYQVMCSKVPFDAGFQI